MHMKAAVLCEQPGELVIEELNIDSPGPQEVLIQTIGAGLCHSDLHFMEGLFRTKLPAVMGHEPLNVQAGQRRYPRTPVTTSSLLVHILRPMPVMPVIRIATTAEPFAMRRISVVSHRWDAR